MSNKLEEKYLAEGSDYLLSYTEISGKKIKDITGYMTTEFGEPTFKLCHVEFDDGTEQGVEGVHDLPYLVEYDDKTYKVLEQLDQAEDE